MECNAFYKEIQKIVSGVYEGSALQIGEDFSELKNKANQVIQEHADFIKEATGEWTAEQWKSLFFLYVKDGNVDPEQFVFEKLKETCGTEFFAECIRENASILENDVYFTEDKDALYASDVLLAAVKLLNGSHAGGADEAVLTAFRVCRASNEHILYDFAAYLCREARACAAELIADESVEGDKLLTLLSAAAAESSREESMFKAMKQRFKKIPDTDEEKAVFAAILGDYGEPNAILPLRRYMKALISIYEESERNETFFQRIMMVSSVIEGLGGSAEDLMP